MAELTVGSIFAGHRIESIAGRGGMGVVYRATHLTLDVPVALKVIAPEHAADEQFRQRFKRESRLAAAIDHPHVVPIRHAGEEDGVLYITMRYIEGTDLAGLIARRGRLDPHLGAELVGQVGSALDAAHARGLIHRDVKPANVLVAGAQHAYLGDFGLSKTTTSQSAATREGMFVGTVDYVAPEQAMGGAVDARTDVYALGAVLYHVLTGAVPYPRPSDLAKVWAHMNEPPPSVVDAAAGVPAQFDAVIRRAMAKEVDARYQSAGELGRAALQAAENGSERDLATAVTGAAEHTETDHDRPPPPTVVSRGAPAPAELPASATSGTAGRQPSARASRTRLAGWIAALAALALGAGLLVSYTSSSPEVAKDGGKPRAATEDRPAPKDRRPNPAGRRVGAPIAVGSRPFGLAVDDQGTWAPAFGDDSVSFIAPRARRAETRVDVGDGPFSATVGAGAAWVTNVNDDTVSRIDPASKSVAGPPIAVGDAPYYISAGYGSVWVANGGDDTVSQIDPATNRTIGPPIPVGDAPRGIATMPSFVWVANSNDDTVTRIDRREGRVLGSPIPVGDDPNAIAITQGILFVANKGDDSVTRVKASTGSPLGSPTKVGDAPFAIAAREGSVFVTNSGDDTVSRLSPDTGEVVGRPIRVPGQPTGVRIGQDAVWVVSNDTGSLSRIEP
jgi:YVTN family beta-propeller protein